MDCCKYGEYRAGPAQYPGAGAPWEGYCAPMPYAPYAHAYYAHAHDPYARYYRYNYPVHHPHSEHVLPMDYAYASKEVRMRRALSRRERPLLPAQHPHTLTPPLECGMNGRGSTYCEPPMWPHYQMGALGSGGWNGSNPTGGSWSSRSSCSREHARYPTDCRQVKGPQIHTQNQACLQDGRSTPYRAYEDSLYNGESTVRQGSSPEYPTACATPSDPAKVRSRFYPEPRRSPPEEKRPPLVPLPAFQQAFGSTEIGKFAEAFSRTEVALDEASDNFPYESFPEWDVTPEPQWSSQPASREIKCEDNY